MNVSLGALAGLMAACGLLLIVSASRRRHLTLDDRLAPYTHEQPATSGLLSATAPDADGRTISLVLLAAIGSRAWGHRRSRCGAGCRERAAP